MHRPVVRINGADYDRFTSFTVSKSIAALSHSFSFSTDDPRDSDNDAIPVALWDEAVVEIDGADVVTGHITRVHVERGPDVRRIDVSGASSSKNLVDSSVEKLRTWRDTGIDVIAAELTEPFGIPVNMDFYVPTVRKFSTEAEETVHDALRRLADIAAGIWVTDSSGELFLTRPPTTTIGTSIPGGVHVLRASRTDDGEDRFSSYTAIGQVASTRQYNGKDAADIGHKVTDSIVTQHRPMVVVADGDSDDIKRRAEHEQRRRQGLSKVLTYRVEGWAHADRVWEPNVLVRVVDKAFGNFEPLLVQSVRMDLSGPGPVTELELVAPEAFDVMRPPTKRGLS